MYSVLVKSVMTKTPGKNWNIRGRERGHSRELVLVVCFLSLIGLFSVTAFVARMYHKRVHTLAEQWFTRGLSDFQAGDTKTALIDYRNAFAFSPTNPVFQFHLAQALAANGDLPQAQAYLLQLLSQSPGSGDINLALARIAAQQSKTQDAMMYYNSAIYGEWTEQPIEKRWDARRELCEYLLDKGATTQAEPALIALADNTPDGDVEKEKIVANLLLRAQMWNRALDEFRAILAGGANDPGALEGAGVAAYNLGQYPEAISYFERLPRVRVSEPELAGQLRMARLMVETNPFLPGLTTAEKARRTASALRVAEGRAQACLGKTSEPGSSQPQSGKLGNLLTAAQAQKKNWNERGFIRDPDLINPAMDAAFQLENEAPSSCGGLTDEDRALLMIAQSKTGNSSQ
jgi:tetratricopeptide (TPR) repeat protein